MIQGEVKLQDFPSGLAANEASRYNTAEKPIKTEVKREEAEKKAEEEFRRLQEADKA